MPLSPSQKVVRGDACFGSSTFSRSSGRQATCRRSAASQPRFLTKEKDPTSKQFGDVEWIRSLAEAQEATTDVPEDSVTYDQQDVDPKKVRPIQMGEFLRKYVSRRLLALSEGEIAASRRRCDRSEWVPPGGAEVPSLPHVKLAPMSAPAPAGERQEHLDAIVSFAGAGQR